MRKKNRLENIPSRQDRWVEKSKNEWFKRYFFISDSAKIYSEIEHMFLLKIS